MVCRWAAELAWQGGRESSAFIDVKIYICVYVPCYYFLHAEKSLAFLIPSPLQRVKLLSHPAGEMSNTPGCGCPGILLGKVFHTQCFSHLSAKIWLEGSSNSYANSNRTIDFLQDFSSGSHCYVTRHITKTL